MVIGLDERFICHVTAFSRDRLLIFITELQKSKYFMDRFGNIPARFLLPTDNSYLCVFHKMIAWQFSQLQNYSATDAFSFDRPQIWKEINWFENAKVNPIFLT